MKQQSLVSLVLPVIFTSACLLFQPDIFADISIADDEKTGEAQPVQAAEVGCKWKDAQGCKKVFGLGNAIGDWDDELDLFWVFLLNEEEITPAKWEARTEKEQNDLFFEYIALVRDKLRQLDRLLLFNFEEHDTDTILSYSSWLAATITWFSRPTCKSDPTAQEWLVKLNKKAEDLLDHLEDLRQKPENQEIKPQISDSMLLIQNASPHLTGRISKMLDNSEELEIQRGLLIKELRDNIVSSNTISNAYEECARIMREMLEHTPIAILQRLVNAKVHTVIIPYHTKLTDMPQFIHLKDKETFDGRKWDDVRGIGNVKQEDGSIAIAIGEENFFSRSYFQAHRRIPGSVFTHEFGHALHIGGMSEKQQSEVASTYWDNKLKVGICSDEYACSNGEEYFARATDLWFGAHAVPQCNWSKSATQRYNFLYKHRSVARLPGLKTVPAYKPQWIKEHDPAMYQLLLDIYGKPRKIKIKLIPGKVFKD
ncbi:hypothetical protein ACFL6Y_09735 [Elusimicrobiota bacterium]